nr:MAG TPA: hypothetical protein [Caudoviricetes sp.]DAY49106.1 MAG TPA: hypothetical protein [Caudoviricetes sp.]
MSIFYLTKENICRIGRSSKFLPQGGYYGFFKYFQ